MLETAVPAPSPRGAPPAAPGRVWARSGLAAAVLVAASGLLHLAYAGWLPLSPQEAYYWEWSRRLDLSYFDHPPLAAWTIRLATELLGDSERAIRAAAAFHSAVFSAFLFLAARRLFGARVAVLALAAAMVVPLFSIGQVIITPDGPLLSGWAMALYFTVRALDEERPPWLLAAGAATGWAVLGKYTGFLLLPQIFLALALDARGRRMLRTPWPWLGAVLALALFSPVIAWNAGREFASLAFQSEGRVQASRLRPVLTARFVALQAAAVTPLVLLLSVEAIVAAWRRRREAPWRIVLLFSAPLLVLAAAISPFHWVKMNWLAPVYPAAFVGATALAAGAPGWRRRLAPWALALAAAGSIYVHLVPVAPSVPFPARDELSSGWRELAARVERELASMPAGAIVVGCNYKTAAELAYYLPGRPATHSQEVFGEPGLQYGYWLDASRLAGREALVVVDDREKGCRRKEQVCTALAPLPDLVVRRGRDPVTTFRLWRCRLPESP